MKKIIFLTAFICLIMSSFAQNSHPTFQYDPRLYEVLPAEEIAIYEKDAPAKLWDINYDLTHFGYVDSKLPENCVMMNDICNYVQTGKTCNVAEIVGSKKFNKFNYGLTSDPQKYVAYPLDNTGFYVILPPTTEYARQKAVASKKMGF